MTDPTKPGPTGEFPEGKLIAEDEGEINVQIGAIMTDIGPQIMINFASPVAWLSMPIEEAEALANLILHHVNEVKKLTQ